VGGVCSANGEEERFQIIGVNAKGKKPLGRPRHRWVYNIKIDIIEIRCEMWNGLIWLRMHTVG
jgi:hypothetical protein